MRIPRSVQLHELSGFVHVFWRCHNKEFYLQQSHFKNLYFYCIREAFKKISFKENISINSYCAMGNHFHKIIQYKNGSSWLSLFMRQVHGVFGARYNKIVNRSGKVAEGRPKTPLIENTKHLMRVHFYVEANPVRAKICNLDNLKNYKYSSYSFYAFGVKNQFTNLLTIPEWYMELGETRKERQKQYRMLFREYLFESGYSSEIFLGLFIGSTNWKNRQVEKYKTSVKNKFEAEYIRNNTS